MIPAEERLEAQNCPIGETDDGLIDQRELTALHGAAKVVFEMQQSDGGGVHSGLKDFVAGPPERLGAIHGDIGIAKEFLSVAVMGSADGDADARCDKELVAAQIERSGHDAPKPLGRAHRVLRLLDGV